MIFRIQPTRRPFNPLYTEVGRLAVLARLVKVTRERSRIQGKNNITN